MALPSNYTELEYISTKESEGTSSAWIDTGFVPTLDTRVLIDFMPTSLSESNSYVFGEWVSWQYGYFGCFLKGGGNYPGISWHYSDSHHSTDVTAVINTRYTIDANKETWTLKDGDGTTLHTYTFTRGETRGHKNLYLFTFNGAGNRMLGRIYSCKIYDDGTLARDLVPCKNADGVVGLYDNVNGQFYGSSSSTDAFIAGPEVEGTPTVVSTAVTYAKGATKPADSAFTATNKASVAVTAGDTLWTRTVKTWSDNTETSEYTSETVTVSATSTMYSTSHSNSQPADSTFTSTTIAGTNPNEGDKVWSKTTTTYSTGYVSAVYASTTYTHGEVTSVTTYSTTATASGGTQPADSTFTATNKATVVVSEGQWLWSRTVSTYADGTSAGTTYAHEAVSVSGTATAYSTSHTTTQPADSTFTASTEAATNPTDGDTVWQRTTTTYSTGYIGKAYSSHVYVTDFLAQAFITITDLNDGQAGAPMGRNILRHAADLITDDENPNIFENAGDDGGEYQGCAVSYVDRTDKTTMMEPLRWFDMDTRLETGVWYTVQVTCKGSGQGAIVLADNSAATVEYSLDGGRFFTGGYFAPVFDLTDVWTRHYVTFRYTSGMGAYLRIRCYQGGELYATQPKLEEGEEPTAFCVNEADLVGPQGAAGDDGKSVVKISDKVEYATSDNGTTPPSTGWAESVPTTTTDKPFLWTRCTTKYENASDLVSYSVSRKGDNGTSVTITKTETLYYVESKGDADYGEEPSADKYTEGFPEALKTGDYLWSLTRVTYSDNNKKTETVSASRIGDDGAAGVGIHIAYATSANGEENFKTEYFPEATYIGTYQDSEAYSPDSENPVDYNWSKLVGEDAVFYEVECSNIAPNTTNTSVTVIFTPYKITGNTRTKISDMDGENDYLAIESNSGLEKYNGQYAASVDKGNTSIIQATLIIGRKAVAKATCNPVVNGGKGDKGNDSTIDSTITEYAVTDSGAEEPTTWNTTRPNVEKGQWLWSRTTVNYTSGDGTKKPSVTIAVSYVGEDGHDGTSVEIKGKPSYIVDGVVEKKEQLPTSATEQAWYLVETPSPQDGYVYIYEYESGEWADLIDLSDEDMVFCAGTHMMYKAITDTNPNEVIEYRPSSSEGFLVNGHLWFYSVNQGVWEDAGQIQGPKGDKGDTGRGISSADVMFCVSASQTSAPADSAFGNTTATGLITAANADKYLWQCTKTAYTSGSPTYTGKTCLGQVKGFATVNEQYAVSTSGTTAPTTGWVDDAGSLTMGESTYLWTRSVLVYANGPTTSTTPVCVGYWGTNGQGTDGEDACNLELNPSPLVWTQNDTGEFDKNGQPVDTDTMAVWDSQTIKCTFYKGGTEVDTSSSNYVFSYAIGTDTELSVSDGGAKGTFKLSNPTGSWTQGTIRFTLRWNGKTFSRDLTIGLNRVGEWHQTIKGDVMTSTSTKIMQEVEDGYVKQTVYNADIKQMGDQLDLSVKVDGVERSGLTLDGEGVTVKADKFQVVTPDTGEKLLGVNKDGNLAIKGVITAQATYQGFSALRTAGLDRVVYLEPKTTTDIIGVLSFDLLNQGDNRILYLPYPGEMTDEESGKGRVVDIYGAGFGYTGGFHPTLISCVNSNGTATASQDGNVFSGSGDNLFSFLGGLAADGIRLNLYNEAKGGTAHCRLLARYNGTNHEWTVVETNNCEVLTQGGGLSLE